jgi:hypothetical protein
MLFITPSVFLRFLTSKRLTIGLIVKRFGDSNNIKSSFINKISARFGLVILYNLFNFAIQYFKINK